MSLPLPAVNITPLIYQCARLDSTGKQGGQLQLLAVGQEEHTERRKKIQTAATQQLKLHSCWTPLLVCLVLALALPIIRNEKK